MSVYDIRSAEHQEMVTGHHTPVTRIGAMDLTDESLQVKGYEYQETGSEHHTPVTRFRGGLDVAGDYELPHQEYIDAYGVTRHRGWTAQDVIECGPATWDFLETVTINTDTTCSIAEPYADMCNYWQAYYGSASIGVPFWGGTTGSCAWRRFDYATGLPSPWDTARQVVSFSITAEPPYNLNFSVQCRLEQHFYYTYAFEMWMIAGTVLTGATPALRRQEVINWAAEPHWASIRWKSGFGVIVVGDGTVSTTIA